MWRDGQHNPFSTIILFLSLYFLSFLIGLFAIKSHLLVSRKNRKEKQTTKVSRIATFFLPFEVLQKSGIPFQVLLSLNFLIFFDSSAISRNSLSSRWQLHSLLLLKSMKNILFDCSENIIKMEEVSCYFMKQTCTTENRNPHIFISPFFLYFSRETKTNNL